MQALERINSERARALLKALAERTAGPDLVDDAAAALRRLTRR